MCFCVRYKVFSVYCTPIRTEKSCVYKEDLRLKWDLMWFFFYLMKLKFNLKQFGSIRFLTNFFVFLSLFHYNSPKTYYFIWTIYIRLCWRHLNCCKDNAICGHKKIISKLCLYFLKHTWREQSPKYLGWFLEPNLELDSFCIFIKRMELSSKSDTLPSISQSWVDFEET